jgi:hypothetical protein
MDKLYNVNTHLPLIIKNSKIYANFNRWSQQLPLLALIASINKNDVINDY